MKRTHFAFVFTEDDGSYSCNFPDLPGQTARAESFHDLELQARSVVETTLQTCLDEGKELPEQREFPDVAKMTWKEERQVATIIPITAYLKDAPIRINITSTTAQIEEITDFAKKIGKTRSEFMVAASLDYIKKHS